MIKRLKKGFTLVELVVVIAVIAILAAVSVVSYIGITKKAQESNDKMVIDQINSSLETSQIFDKKLTLHEIVERFEEEEGYDVRAIKPELADTEFVFSYEKGKLGYWKAKENKVVYPSDLDGMTKNNDLWFFSDGQAKFDDGASHYIKDAKGFETIETEGGIDLGKTTGVKKVVYDRKDATDAGQSVVIRTNSKDMELEVNAPKDTLKHFGDVGTLNIIAIKNKSCHEYGSAEFVEIKSGRYALEKGSEVNHIHFVAKTSSTFGDITISKDQNVEMPAFSRDNVEIATQGTLVVALQSGTEEITESTDLDYVWLTKQGIYEQIVVSDNGETKENAGSSQVEWVNTSSKSAETKEAAQQIANNIGRDETGKASGTVTVDEVEYVVTVDPVTRDLVVEDTDGNPAPAAVVDQAEAKAVEEKADKEESKKGATLFGGGSGTQFDPFLVYNYETMQNISSLYNEGYRYYEVALEKTDNGKIDCRNQWTAVELNGSFDGKGVVFNNLNAQLFRSVGKAPSDETYVIKNLTINANINIAGYGAAAIRQAGNNLVLDSVTVHGYIEGNNGASSFVCFGPGNIASSNASGQAMNWKFKNCYSDATIVATGDVAVGFVKHPYSAASQSGGSAANQDKCLLVIEDSIFEGRLSDTNTSSYARKYFVGNGNNMLVKTSYSDAFIEKYGNPEGTLYHLPTDKTDDGVFFIGNYPGEGTKIEKYKDYGTCMDRYLGSNSLLSKLTGALPEKYNVFTVNKTSGAVSAKVTLEIAPNGTDEKGSYLGTYMSEMIDVSGSADTFTTSQIKYFDVTVNGSSTSSTGLSSNGRTFNIVSSSLGTTYNGASVRVTQYDSNSNVISITTFTFVS